MIHEQNFGSEWSRTGDVGEAGSADLVSPLVLQSRTLCLQRPCVCPTAWLESSSRCPQKSRSTPTREGLIQRVDVIESRARQLRVSGEPRAKHPPGDGRLQTAGVFTLQVGRLVRTHPFILAELMSRQSETTG